MFSFGDKDFSLRIKGCLKVIDQPLVMGILNVTENSFFDGGRYHQTDVAVNRALQMLKEGADIIDIGGMSSKPGSTISDAAEELSKVLPVVKAILDHQADAIISIDTVHAKVADACLQAGAAIINDISGGTFDENMLSIVAEHRAPYVLMHMQGLPQNMQDSPQYKDVVAEIIDFFNTRLEACYKAGIADVILDPGIGFGKTMEHNFRLLKHFSDFRIMGLPLLIGISRKSLIWKTLNTSAEKALNGTTALNMHALMNGTQVLRVHDVVEAKECVTLFQSLKSAL
jgi:dihydropteroate synthase